MKGGFTETRISGIKSTDYDQDAFDPDSKVLYRIISSFRTKSPVKKTQIQLASKLRWDSFSRYWKWLQIRDYVQCVDVGDKNDFMLTPKGNELFSKFLSYYEYLRMDNSLLVMK